MKSFVILVVTLGFSTAQGTSCECTPIHSIKDKVRSADLVFKGVVQSVGRSDTLIAGTFPTNFVRFNIEKKYKTPKDFGSKRLEVFTFQKTGARCGYEFKVGATYMVYGTQIEGEPDSESFITTLCSGNTEGQLAAAEEPLVQTL